MPGDKTMIIWGMVGNSHDASLAVFRKTENKLELLWAALSKDFSNVDNDPHFNWTIIEVARKNFGDPDQVVWYENPFTKSLRQLWARQGFLFKENNIKAYLKQWNIDVPIKYVPHHLSHAAYGYYTSGWNHGNVICIDSIGEFETLTMWRGDGDTLTKISSQSYPNSLGLWYSAMTQRLGYTPNKQEAVISTLAKSGNPYKYKQKLYDDFFEVTYDPLCKIKFKENCHRGLRWYAPEIKDIDNLAASVQHVFEDLCMKLTTSIQYNNPSTNLAVTGGCALNRGAMDKIRKNWRGFWIPTNPGDPGSCIGAVLALEKKHIDFDEEIWYNNKTKKGLANE